jgi:hypothetical protein
LISGQNLSIPLLRPINTYKLYKLCVHQLDIGFGSASIFEPARPTAQQEQAAKSPIWSIAYYSKFFDVDTNQVRFGATQEKMDQELDPESGSTLFKAELIAV